MSVFGTGVEIAGESIVLFGIGFLLAALLGLSFFPLVHNRAVRLTTRRIDAQTPCSIKEIQVEKDLMRAEFAVLARRSETSIEDLRAKTCAQNRELAQKSSAITDLEDERDRRAAEFAALEERAREFDEHEKSLRDQLRANEEQLRASEEQLRIRNDEVARLKETLRNAERLITNLRLNRSTVGSVIAEYSRLVGFKRNEIVALRTEVDTIRHQAKEIVAKVKTANGRAAPGPTAPENASAAAHKNGGLNGAAVTGTSANAHPHKNGRAAYTPGRSDPPRALAAQTTSAAPTTSASPAA